MSPDQRCAGRDRPRHGRAARHQARDRHPIRPGRGGRGAQLTCGRQGGRRGRGGGDHRSGPSSHRAPTPTSAKPGRCQAPRGALQSRRPRPDRRPREQRAIFPRAPLLELTEDGWDAVARHRTSRPHVRLLPGGGPSRGRRRPARGRSSASSRRARLPRLDARHRLHGGEQARHRGAHAEAWPASSARTASASTPSRPESRTPRCRVGGNTEDALMALGRANPTGRLAGAGGHRGRRRLPRNRRGSLRRLASWSTSTAATITGRPAARRAKETTDREEEDRHETHGRRHHGAAGRRIDRSGARTSRSTIRRGLDHAHRRRHRPGQLEPHRRCQLAGGGTAPSSPTRARAAILVSKNSYKDFQIRAEFWADHTTNSGIFIRCTDPKKIGADNCLRGEHLRPAPRPVLRHRAHRQRRQGDRRCPRPAASGTPTRSRPRARSSPSC